MEPWQIAAGVYAVMSLVAFTAHGWDKRKAIKGASRISEARLHLFELLGGWPGAMLGMALFRHKTRKGSYLFWFWLIVVVHVAGAAYLLTR